MAIRKIQFMKKIVILGSTGSIGKNAIEVIKNFQDKFSVYGIAAANSIDLLASQVMELNCKHVVCSKNSVEKLKNKVSDSVEIGSDIDGMVKLVTAKEVDIVLCAVVGTSALLPILEAIKAKKDIAIASKEILVMAGELVMKEAKRNNVKLIPVDSEHCAIFQCLEGKSHSDLSKVILTASGGPFRTWKISEIEKATYEQALNHPTWSMGPKITLDSASLMNKALEIIEAKWLFNLRPEQIDVIIHPQSIIHSMVEFKDGTILAQMSITDMKFPIQYALSYPEKLVGLKSLSLSELKEITFEKPDKVKFPSLDFAYYALNELGTMPAVMNAANESAVILFQNKKIRFPQIWKIIESTMSAHKNIKTPSLDEIITADAWAKEYAFNLKL